MVKTIGIVGYRSLDGMLFGVGNGYLEWVSRFGKPRILMPAEELADIDLLLLPGGPDMAPQSFGATPTFRTTVPDVFRQFFFEKRLASYINAGIPVFGICLGFQMLAVHFGSTLQQHLHRHPQNAVHEVPGHIVEPLPAAARYGTRPFEVNSSHHQGVISGDLSAELEALALAKYGPTSDDMIVEAFRHCHKPVMAVQWHPENWLDSFAEAMISDLLANP